MYLICLLVLLSVSCVQSDAYVTHHLENLCNSVDDEGEISIPAWGAAILKLGHQPKYTVTSAGTPIISKIGDCTVNVEAEEGFGLTLVVEDMNIRGIKDRTINKMICDEYMKFSTSGKWKSLINKVTPGNPFKSKTSRLLCGKSHNAGDNIKDISLRRLNEHLSATEGNIFYTKNSNIEVIFSQHPYVSINNSFTLILTSYKRTLESCEGRFRCSGSNIYCVNEAFECDNHINCAFPGSGGDENPILCPVEQTPTLSTSTIIIILACLSGVALLLFYICVLKSKRKVVTEYPQDNINGPQAAARQQSLPMYEAVVAFHTEHSDAISIGPTPVDPKDVPPSYDQLFPDGPPKQEKDVEESAAIESSADNLTPPSGTVSAEESAKNPVLGSENIS